MPWSPYSNIFLWIAASVAAGAVNPNGIKTLWANDLSKFSIKGNPVFSNGSKSLAKNPSYCPILCKLIFDNFILAEDLFAKAWRTFENWLSVNNNLYRKLFLSFASPTTLNDILKVTGQFYV